MSTGYVKDSTHNIRHRIRQPLRPLWEMQGDSTDARPCAPARWLFEDDVLACVDFLEGKPAHIRQRYKQVPAKTVIVHKGDPATHLFIVLSGKVKVSAPSEDGKEITFGILGPGELVGEVGVLEGAEHLATVTALVPTALGILDRQDFLSLLESRPGFSVRILRILCKRLRGASEMAEDISFLPLSKRLAKRLHALGQTYGELLPDGVRIALPLCQQELANLIATSRESVNKQLRFWEAEGLLTMDHGYLTLRNINMMSVLTESQLDSCSPSLQGSGFYPAQPTPTIKANGKGTDRRRVLTRQYG